MPPATPLHSPPTACSIKRGIYSGAGCGVPSFSSLPSFVALCFRHAAAARRLAKSTVGAATAAARPRDARALRRYLVGYPILDNCEIWRSQKPHEHSPLAGRLDGPYARTRLFARRETFKSLCRGAFAARRSGAFIPFECGRSGRNQEARWRRRREIENAHRVGRNGSEQKENRGKRRRAKH